MDMVATRRKHRAPSRAKRRATGQQAAQVAAEAKGGEKTRQRRGPRQPKGKPVESGLEEVYGDSEIEQPSAPLSLADSFAAAYLPTEDCDPALVERFRAMAHACRDLAFEIKWRGKPTEALRHAVFAKLDILMRPIVEGSQAFPQTHTLGRHYRLETELWSLAVPLNKIQARWLYESDNERPKYLDRLGIACAQVAEELSARNQKAMAQRKGKSGRRPHGAMNEFLRVCVLSKVPNGEIIRALVPYEPELEREHAKLLKRIQRIRESVAKKIARPQAPDKTP